MTHTDSYSFRYMTNGHGIRWESPFSKSNGIANIYHMGFPGFQDTASFESDVVSPYHTQIKADHEYLRHVGN